MTRGGQITLAKEVRDKLRIKEGDTIMLNLSGESILISKKDPKAFERSNFLPDNFSKTLKDMRSFSYPDRLRRLGVI